MHADTTLDWQASPATFSRLQLAALVGLFGVGLQVAMSIGGHWRTQVLLFLAFYLAGSLVLTRGFGLFDPRSLFFISFGVYVASGPADTFFLGNSLNLDLQRQSISLYYSTLFLVAAVGGMALTRRRDVSDPTVDGDAEEPALSPDLFLGVLGVLSVAYLLLADNVYGWALLSRSRAELYSNKSLVLDLFRFCVAVSGVFAAWTLRVAGASRLRQGLLLAFIGLFLMTELLFLGDRRIGVGLLFGFLFVTHFGRRTTRRTYVLLATLVVLMQVFGHLRARPAEAWGATIQENFDIEWLNPATSEFGGYSLLADAYILDHTELSENRMTYAEAFLCLIPQSIYPDRPLAPTERAAETYFPLMYRVGGARAFNAVLESMLNLWILGPLVVGLTWGAGLTALSRWAQRPAGLLVAGVLLQVILFAARLSLVDILRTSTILLSVVAALYLLGKLLLLPVRSRSGSSEGSRAARHG